MISMALWQKIQIYIDAFGEMHPEFAAALDNMRAAIEGNGRQIVRAPFPLDPSA